MPRAAKTPCRQAGCRELVDRPGYCDKHKKETRKQFDRQRGSSAQRGYGSRWQKARLTFLISHPLCVMCSTPNHPVVATVVDHIKPHKGDQKLFWDRSNWQPLCKQCHDSVKKRLEKSGRVIGCNVDGIPTDPNHHWHKGEGG